jgi:dGTPase
MRTREEYLAREAAQLAPYACKAAETRGRVYPESEHPLRSPFERDRDRIIHSSAFRKLEYKTQVFVNHEGDYYRTRLTHTLEASQVSRSVARFLQLNEDLAEALALAHDVGHPPFGHAGETALRELMAEHGGFEHNLQGLRVVDRLESRYAEFPGLNLSWEVREGIVKHSRDWDPAGPAFAEFALAPWPSLEAQVVDASDEIAYNAHDVDDGLTAGMISLAQLRELSIWRQIAGSGLALDDCLPPDQAKYQAVRFLINGLVQDLVTTAEERVARWGIATPDAARAAPDRVATLSPKMQTCNHELREFLYGHVYRHHRVYRMWIKAHRVVGEIFRSYQEAPAQLPPHAFRRIPDEGEPRVICDYLAGLTDREALEEHARLFDPTVST